MVFASSLDNSPTWGVRMITLPSAPWVCSFSANALPFSSARRFSASASSTNGFLLFSTTFFRHSRACSSLPMPGPTAMTSAHSRLSDSCLQDPYKASGIPCCKICRFSSAVMTFTIPAPVRYAALAARIAAPAMPLLPATNSALPKVPLFPEDVLSGRCCSQLS